jgi:hypothetical protein
MNIVLLTWAHGGSRACRHLLHSVQLPEQNTFFHREGRHSERVNRAPHPLILKVPKREIFDRSDFPDFYTIKYSWVGDLLVKILTYYFNF